MDGSAKEFEESVDRLEQEINKCVEQLDALEFKLNCFEEFIKIKGLEGEFQFFFLASLGKRR